MRPAGRRRNLNPLVAALLAADLIDRETAELLDRQLDDERARAWAEQQLLEAFTGALDAQQRRILAAIRAAGRLPGTAFWTGEERRLWAAIEPALSEVAAERAIGAAIRATIDVERAFDFANVQVAAWVRTRYTSDALDDVGSVPNLNRTSREAVARQFQRWQAGELGDEGLPDLVRALQADFGPLRAEAIAVTETTRIFTEAQRQAEAAHPDTTGMRLQTSADERVCAICGPLHGQVRPITRRIYVHPTLGELEGPPFHVRCRCFETPETDLTVDEPLAPEEQFTFTGELPGGAT